MRKRSANSRIAFTPSIKGRSYFDGLVSRLTQSNGVPIKMREAFDKMVEYAVLGENTLRNRDIEEAREKLLRRQSG